MINKNDKRSKFIRELVGQTRKIQCRADDMTTFDSENMIIDNLSISSESEEVIRYNWSKDRYYTEVLSHTPGDADLTRFNNGAPFLLDHDRRNQLGVIEHAELSGTKCRMRVRFSKSGDNKDARRIFDEMKDRIRKNVSVSYEVVAAELVEQGDDAQGTLDKIRLKWIGLEGSSVTVPADSTVGVDRSADPVIPETEPIDTVPQSAAVVEEAERIKESVTEKNKKREVTTMTEEEKRAAAEKAALEKDEFARVAVQTYKDSRQAVIKDLNAVADAHPDKPQVRKIVQECISADLDHETAMHRVLTEGFKAVPIDEAAERAARIVDVSKRDAAEYSVSSALAAIHDKRFYRADYNSLEKEITLELCKRYKRAPSETGILVPFNLMTASQKRDLNTGTSTAGGNIVATDLLAGSFIELLTNAMKTAELGVGLLTGLMGNIAIPTKSGRANTYWTAEGVETTEAELTFGQITATPHKVSAWTEYTYELLVQGNPDIDALVKQDHIEGIGLALDLAVLIGSGSGAEPEGIVNKTGVNTVAIGTNGGAPTDIHMIDLETAIGDDNAILNALKYLVTSGTKGKLKKTAIESGQTDRVWDRISNRINGLESHVSNQLPIDGTKGTGTALHTAILADWTQAKVCMWGVMEMTTNPFSKLTSGIVQVVSKQLADIVIRHPESFGFINDIDITA